MQWYWKTERSLPLALFFNLQEPVSCAVGRSIDERSQRIVDDCAYIVPFLDSLEALIQVDEVMNEVNISALFITSL